ncbi:MAG TPA: hypothetical protein VL122_11620 [Nitrospirota bacterium]|nr:hypothetical protein [Nitrospirota bacterium]
MKENKHAFPKKVLILLLALAGLSGCLNRMDEGPKIANLIYATLRAPLEEKGVFTVTGAFNIIHAQGETASVNTIVYDAQGKQVAQESIPLTDTALRTSNTVAFGIDCSTAKKGVYTFLTSVKDDKGRQSNGLMGAFAITDVF